MPIHPSVLAQIPLLRDLTPQRHEELAAQSHVDAYARRAVVIDKGSRPPFLFFLLEGRLQAIDFTLDGREVGLYFVEELTYFGEISLLDEGPQPEMIIANSPSHVLRIPAGVMRPLLFDHPELLDPMIRGLTRRIREHTVQRQILGINNPLQRICAQLYQLSRAIQQQQVIVKAPTQQELAITVNLTRETVTRTFQVLQSQGVLTRNGNDLVIDAERLRKMSEGTEK